MADSNNGSGLLYFLVGALCVAVALGAFVIFGGVVTSPSSTAPSTAQAPASTTPTVTKNITIEKTEPARVIERERH
ncbi:MAG TPA: hypothetical protein VMI56_08090 [Reyranella sp.]|nr:hypothetical protein [Reyranella sp.]